MTNFAASKHLLWPVAATYSSIRVAYRWNPKTSQISDYLGRTHYTIGIIKHNLILIWNTAWRHVRHNWLNYWQNCAAVKSATPNWSYKFIHVAYNWNKSEPVIRVSAYNTHYNLFETLYPLLLSYVGLQVYLPNYFHKGIAFLYTCFMKLIN